MGLRILDKYLDKPLPDFACEQAFFPIFSSIGIPNPPHRDIKIQSPTLLLSLGHHPTGQSEGRKDYRHHGQQQSSSRSVGFHHDST